MSDENLGEFTRALGGFAAPITIAVGEGIELRASRVMGANGVLLHMHDGVGTVNEVIPENFLAEDDFILLMLRSMFAQLAEDRIISFDLQARLPVAVALARRLS